MTVATIAPSQLHELGQAGKPVDLIDVRTPAEFREIHIDGAQLMPLDRLDPIAVMAGRQEGGAPVYVICRSGSRAKQACEKLQAAGYNDAVLVEGGLLAWEKAGLPVKRGKKTISLERQVRIAAGALVLTGLGLSLVSPWFLGLTAFVGAGLVYAGVTDSCGMAMLLARMPWNQVKEEPVSSTEVLGPTDPAPQGNTCCSL